MSHTHVAKQKKKQKLRQREREEHLCHVVQELAEAIGRPHSAETMIQVRTGYDNKNRLLLPGFEPFGEKQYLNMRVLCNTAFNTFPISKMLTPVKFQKGGREKLEKFKLPPIGA